jgi:hypothetical protein
MVYLATSTESPPTTLRRRRQWGQSLKRVVQHEDCDTSALANPFCLVELPVDAEIDPALAVFFLSRAGDRGRCSGGQAEMDEDLGDHGGYPMLLREASIGRLNIRLALFHGSDYALPLFGGT